MNGSHAADKSAHARTHSEKPFRLLPPERIEELFERFKAANPEPKTELAAPNPYTLLVSVVLSAQATDKSVNKATAALYAAADTPQKMLDLGEETLISYIKSIGLYRSKAKHIMELSRILAAEYGGGIPRTREELQKLPGVGRKTANVILNVVYGEPTMPVDTHLLRISPRLGLSDGTTPEAVEKDLVARIPARYMQHAHHWLILHGRYVCTARNPQCAECPVGDICMRNNVAQEE
ncbi:endonuclease III [Treponema brennaborense]|uniref:Endonuclease III n=1 Tax=Treponema brennaborense (strain DSM 12168 / CIP 105900 / DD5/3) TaxID=906968 RepID=F4LN08_TREBD|nr:endonuclease III [Treponema brennaborense]AEE15794.1 endonuclease III [Treponema brennaborense DSM 12168]